MDIFQHTLSYYKTKELCRLELNKDIKLFINLEMKERLFNEFGKKYTRNSNFKIKWMKLRIDKKLSKMRNKIQRLEDLQQANRVREIFGIDAKNKTTINKLKKVKIQYDMFQRIKSIL